MVEEAAVAVEAGRGVRGGMSRLVIGAAVCSRPARLAFPSGGWDAPGVGGARLGLAGGLEADDARPLPLL